MSLPPPEATSPPSPRRRGFPFFTRRQWFAFASISLLIFFACLYFLARMTPSWFQPLDANATDVIDDADVAQNKLRLEIHNTMERVPLGEQEWKITQHQIDSLLAIRFTPPPDAAPSTKTNAAIATSPFVLFSPGKVTVAARSTKIPGNDPTGQGGGVFSVTFVVETTTAADGSPMGVIRISSAAIGNLPIPKSLVENKLKSMVPAIAAVAQQTMTYQLGIRDSSALMPQIQSAIRAISESEPFPLRFRYDRRDVVIHEIRVDDGLLTIVFAPPTPTIPLPR